MNESNARSKEADCDGIGRGRRWHCRDRSCRGLNDDRERLDRARNRGAGLVDAEASESQDGQIGDAREQGAEVSLD